MRFNVGGRRTFPVSEQDFRGQVIVLLLQCRGKANLPRIRVSLEENAEHPGASM